MKFLLLSLFLFSNVAIANSCPSQVFILLQCAPNHKNFQLLKHLGRYTQPKMEFDGPENTMVCAYQSSEWVSKYRYSHGNEEKLISVSTLGELAQVVSVLNDKGFKVDHFSTKSNPYTMLTYKEIDSHFAADQIFLFSGLESTFENDNFNVSALNNKLVSTVVINEKYLKTQNVAADTFETGSNCVVEIK